MAKKSIKETKYCSLLSQSVIADEEYVYALEKIIVKEKQREEIRFAVYKNTLRYGEKLLVRPLDLEEKLLLQLIKKALDDKIFSKEFINDLKVLVNEK